MSWLFQEKIVDSKDVITNLIRDNTQLLDQLNMLLGQKKEFQVSLDARQKNLVSISINMLYPALSLTFIV